jgi:pyruvate dehydrogenase E2 component (dihydrolipoamide acetyltransferase)
MLKKKSNPDDFTGSTITVSAMDHTDVIRFVPIIHPNQSAIISVPKIEKRIDLDNNDKIIKYNTINLGISFDHSFLDANQANNFFIELENQINMIVNNI